MIKDPANPILIRRARAPSTVIPAQSKGPSILVKHVYRMDMDIDTEFEIHIVYCIDAPEIDV